MIKLRKEFKQEVPLEKDEIISLIKKSKDFVTEESPSYGGQLYTSAIMNKVIYNELQDNVIQLSENAGFGGLEVIGEMTFSNVGLRASLITIKFQMGRFPIYTPYILIAVFSVLGLLSLLIDVTFSIIFCFLLFISSVLMFVKQDRVRFFLKKIENVLQISDEWTN